MARALAAPVLALACVALQLAAPAAGAGALAGVGFATYPGCAVDSDVVTITGAEGANGIWVFAATDSNVAGGPSCLAVAPETFVGPFDPAVGGCVGGTFGGVLCIGGSPALAPTNVPLTMCSFFGCVAGEALVTRA